MYEAAEFKESRRKLEDIYDEARAIYNIVYDYAIAKNEEKSGRDFVSENEEKGGRSKKEKKCGFAWKVAGEALCSYYMSLHNERPISCSISALKEILN